MILRRLFATFFIVSSMLGTAAILAPTSASAATASGCNTSGALLGLPPWYKYLDIGPKTLQGVKGALGTTDPCAIIGPLDSNGQLDFAKALPLIGLAVVEILLRIGSLVAVGFVIYGGFRFILSQGEAENTKHARNTILNAVIGLVITIFATLIVNFVGGTILK